MDLTGKKILLHDMCLRDGMHPKQHQITLAQMQAISQALDVRLFRRRLMWLAYR